MGRHQFKPSHTTGELIPDETQRIPVYDYVNPAKAQWPGAEYIVGNPPFIGDKAMRRTLGNGYVDALRSVYRDLPESMDFVLYWWHITATKIRFGEARRFSFITTNSLRQTFNRRVIEPHLNDKNQLLLIVFVIPDHPWVDSVALATGGRLGVGNDPRYNKTRCFETFPFPNLTDAHRKRQWRLV